MRADVGRDPAAGPLQCAATPLRWFAGIAPHPLLAMVPVMLMAGLLLAGCAVGRAVQQGMGGWRGEAATPTPDTTSATAEAPREYYAGVAGLKLYSEPSASSKTVAELTLHEKVTRYRLERGYAYVKVEGRGLVGWVINAQLIWRLPAATMQAPLAPSGTQPDEAAVPAAEEPPVSTAPETSAPHVAPPSLPTPTSTPEAAPPGGTPTPRAVAPSVFDPY